MSAKHSSICTVATAAGVSKSTVSRVINNDCRVSQKTVAAVREAMERLGYVPAPIFCRQGPRLRRRRPVRHQQVALLFDFSSSRLGAPVYQKLIHGVEDRLKQDGWNLVVRHLPAERPWAAIPHRLDGALYLGGFFQNTFHDPHLLRELRKVPTVRIMGKAISEDFFDQVTQNVPRIGAVAAEYLLARGHRHLAVVTHEPGERLADFSAAATALGAEVVPFIEERIIRDLDNNRFPDAEVALRVARQLSGMSPRPTALFATRDTIWVALHGALSQVGIAPDRDLEVVCTDNGSPLLDTLPVRPAMASGHVERIGVRAVEQLYWRLEHLREPRQAVIVEPEIVPGNSRVAI